MSSRAALSRRDFLRGAASSVGAGAVPGPNCGSDPVQDCKWHWILAQAASRLQHEQRSGTLPFEIVPSGFQARRVWAHYFPPFPLSLGNGKGGDAVYASRQFGEGRGTGLLTDLPIPDPGAAPFFRPEVDVAVELGRLRHMGAAGFGVDLLSFNGPMWERTRLLYDAAEAMGDLSLMPQPDLAAFPNIGAGELAAQIAPLCRHARTALNQAGEPVVSPFGGDLREPGFFAELAHELRSHGLKAEIRPAFLNLPAYLRRYPSWRGPSAAWCATDVITQSQMTAALRPQETAANLLMRSVVPQHCRPKAGTFYEAANTGLFRGSWMDAITAGAQDILLTSWNDYGEGTHVAPSLGTQFLFYDLACYFTQWVLLGAPPRITADALLYCHRRQITVPATGACRSPCLALAGRSALENAVELVAFLRTPATVQIQQGSALLSRDVQAGMVSVRMPAAAGTPILRIRRGGRTVVETVSGWTIAGPTPYGDPAYVGGGSAREFYAAGGLP